MIGNIQCSNKYQGNSAGQNGEPVGCNMITLLPGGVGCIVYKKATPCNLQIYLATEEILLDDIFEEEVTVAKIIFDISLLNLFVVYGASKALPAVQSPEEITADTVYTSALNYSVSDRSGATVLFRKFSQVKKGVD